MEAQYVQFQAPLGAFPNCRAAGAALKERKRTLAVAFACDDQSLICRAADRLLFFGV
jgi:hypothetical protein